MHKTVFFNTTTIDNYVFFFDVLLWRSGSVEEAEDEEDEEDKGNEEEEEEEEGEEEEGEDWVEEA